FCCFQKDIALKPHERQEKKPSTLSKKQQDGLQNGLSYHAWKNRHHGPSDQENDQNLGQHQRNKKKTHKRHKWLKPGQNNCKDSDSESASGDSKKSLRSSPHERLSDVSIVYKMPITV
ncbi:autism susceptibility gene 2 protein-like isoform X1, partial [Acipenser oxyrinchus oxyrinchus]